MSLIVVLLTLLLGLASAATAQQPNAPPDCPTQLGMALNRQGTAQTLAKDDREALILYFQKIVQDAQAEARKVTEERDALRKQVDEVTKKAKEPGS